MGIQGKLSILIQSDRHLDYVEKLTAAAHAKGKQLKIHILGDGVAIINSSEFMRLLPMAQVTICANSFTRFYKHKTPTVPQAVKMIQAHQVADIVDWCDRSVVF
jgi:hypothetical protein